jgi:hypothetical protein
LIGRQVEEQHEITVYDHVVRDLESRIRMVNARAFEESPVVPRIHTDTLCRDLFTVHVHDNIWEAEMTKVVGIGSQVPRNSWFLTIVNNRRFGRVPKTASSIPSDCNPDEN